MPVDDVDAGILRDLIWNPENPVDLERGILGAWDIARGLRVHGNTVKRRLQELEDSRTLLGVHMIPDCTVADLMVGFYGVRFDTQEEAVAAERTLVARNLPGVTIRIDGNEVRYNLAVRRGDDLEAAAAEDAARLGATSHHRITLRTWTDVAVSDLERRIIDVYMRDAMLPAAEVADTVGVTARTVRNRIASLAKRRAFCFVPFIDMLAVQGAVPVLFDIDTGGDREAGLRALRAAPEMGLHSAIARPVTLTHVIRSSVADALAVGDRVAAVPGVRSVTPHFVLSSRWSALPDSGVSVSERVARFIETACGAETDPVGETA